MGFGYRPGRTIGVVCSVDRKFVSDELRMEATGVDGLEVARPEVARPEVVWPEVARPEVVWPEVAWLSNLVSA